MSLLAGAFTITDNGRSQPIAEAAASATACNAHLSHRLLYSDQRLTLYSVERSAESPAIPHYFDGEAEHSWVIGDVNYFRELPAAVSAGAARVDRLSTKDVPGCWVAIGYNSVTGTVQLATDRMGLAWLYIARMPGGYIFSSDFGALATAIASHVTLNSDAALSELVVGYAPNGATVFNEITIAPAGSTIQLNRDGMSVISRSPVEYGDRYASFSRSRKFAVLDEIYDKVIGNIIRYMGSGLTLSLSAGNDSRYALGLLGKHSIEPRLFTFGHPESDEVVNAKAVCSRIGRTTTVFEIPDPGWDEWSRMMKQLGNTGMLQWVGWAERWLSFVQSHGNNVIVGYIGDTLSGNYLGAKEPKGADWVGYLVDWLSDDGWLHSPLLRPHARSRAMAAISGQINSSLQNVTCAFPHQKALHANLYGRQRRHTAAQANLMSRFVTPILPFYDHDVIEFWSNVPVDDLFNQNLYLSYAQSRFSRLFPKRPGAGRSLATRVMRKAGRLLYGAVHGGSSVPQRPSVIDRNRAIMPHKGRIIDLSRKVSPLVADLINVDGFCEQVSRYGGGREGNTHGHIIQAVNLFLLLDLCHPR